MCVRPLSIHENNQHRLINVYVNKSLHLQIGKIACNLSVGSRVVSGLCYHQCQRNVVDNASCPFPKAMPWTVLTTEINVFHCLYIFTSSVLFSSTASAFVSVHPSAHQTIGWDTTLLLRSDVITDEIFFQIAMVNLQSSMLGIGILFGFHSSQGDGDHQL